jgi:metal-sulfur cluster biosynthetic enzyme
MPENSYPERTDDFGEKLRLLQEAWERKDFRVARALTHSLRDTAIQAQAEHMPEGQILPSHSIREVGALPPAWRDWAKGWGWFRAIHLDDMLGLERQQEPVEARLGFPLSQITDPAREVRVALVEGSCLREIPSQVHEQGLSARERLASVLFLAPPALHERQTVLIFHGNPDAELPAYSTDLSTTGEGFALQIENSFYKAALSSQMGQLERLTLKRGYGLELVAGGEGHGEPPCIDWAHDYAAAGHYQKFRLTLWETCPDYEVVRGPVATCVRRWGFPHSPLHPLFTPARLHVDVEYRFYAGVPWFQKTGVMTALKPFEAAALRDDEWVFTGQPFTDIVWMGTDGKLRTGPPDPASRDQVWALGFANPKTGDSFVGLFLEHSAQGLPELKHNASPMLYYKAHGQVWSRYPLPVKQVPAGAVLQQKNAYAALEFTPENGAQRIEELRHCLANPLQISSAETGFPARAEVTAGRLARPGEAGDSPIPKRLLWEALHDCRDEQMYTANLSVVDLGLIRDVRVQDRTVHVLMTMPHRGRPRSGYFAFGSGGNSVPIRTRLLRVPGVENVVVQTTWNPPWNSTHLSAEGRKKLQLDA